MSIALSCGIILLPNRYIDDSVSPQTRRPWYAEVRGIYSEHSAGDIAITGLGIVRTRNILRAPLDRHLSYVDKIEPLEEWTLCEPSESRWCFGFHDSCWRLLLLRLRDHNETAVAESVFNQRHCTPCINGSGFQFGHDYGGAAQTHISSGLPKAVDLTSPFYDPCAIPDDLEVTASDFRKTHDGLLWKGQAPLPFSDTRERPKHIFDRLSPELKLEIFSYISFGELLNMRLVCRDLALFSTVDTLPQSYWRGRFLLGQEADFLFPSTDTQDWSRLYFCTRASLKAGLLPLINRKRIRQLLEPVAALMELDALQNGPYGSAFLPGAI